MEHLDSCNILALESHPSKACRCEWNCGLQSWKNASGLLPFPPTAGAFCPATSARSISDFSCGRMSSRTCGDIRGSVGNRETQVKSRCLSSYQLLLTTHEFLLQQLPTTWLKIPSTNTSTSRSVCQTKHNFAVVLGFCGICRMQLPSYPGPSPTTSLRSLTSHLTRAGRQLPQPLLLLRRQPRLQRLGRPLGSRGAPTRRPRLGPARRVLPAPVTRPGRSKGRSTAQEHGQTGTAKGSDSANSQPGQPLPKPNPPPRLSRKRCGSDHFRNGRSLPKAPNAVAPRRRCDPLCSSSLS